MHAANSPPNQDPGLHAENNVGDRETGNVTNAINVVDKGKTVMVSDVKNNPHSLGICGPTVYAQVNADPNLSTSEDSVLNFQNQDL